MTESRAVRWRPGMAIRTWSRVVVVLAGGVFAVACGDKSPAGGGTGGAGAAGSTGQGGGAGNTGQGGSAGQAGGGSGAAGQAGSGGQGGGAGQIGTAGRGGGAGQGGAGGQGGTGGACGCSTGCCRSDSSCGTRVGNSLGPCVQLVAGTPDSSCPSWNGGEGTLLGCCLSNGGCGISIGGNMCFAASEVGLSNRACSIGTGGAGGATGAGGGGGTAGAECAQATTLAACNALPGCHALYTAEPRTPVGTCTCPDFGCCSRFIGCAAGARATCTGPVVCTVAAPYCETTFSVANDGSCYVGCVRSSVCAP